jgi:hypothetical protein
MSPTKAALIAGATLSSLALLALPAIAAPTAPPVPSGTAISVASVRGAPLPEVDFETAAPPAVSTPSTATAIEAKCILLAEKNDSSPTLVSA